MGDPQGNDDAIAIVGMSCRFAPDLVTPDLFWEHLLDGRTAVKDMPEKRWLPYAQMSPQATAALRRTTLVGSYLDDIEGFDAEFFGITPKEAASIDPQQRFMLELTWEALANAGIPPLGLAGTDAGVYAAVNSTDYGRRLLEDMSRTGPYAVNGTTDYGIANRVSYFLDTRGPSMAVSTACAASLTALHVACQGLKDGETSLAIVGGLNIMSTPVLNVALEGAGALAPDGRSKACDATADGYGRGEGAGVVVLKRYKDAVRDNDPVLALIRGTGVYQDGHSDGMMAPSEDAQAHMLASVYARAGIAPDTIDYVEAHGTGTPAGDAAELRALARVVGAGRPEQRPCLVGSAKPNVGHVEGGAGLVGLLKVVLALTKEVLPATLHTAPTNVIEWGEAGLQLVAVPTPWPATTRRVRRAGISSYGVGGAIAHAIVEEAPSRRRHCVASDGETGWTLPLSAASEAGLRSLATQTADWLKATGEVRIPDLAHTLTMRRSHLPYRASVSADSIESATAAFAALGQGDAHPAVEVGYAPSDALPLVWVFSGHGAQWAGMGQDLLDTDAAFTKSVDELGAIFKAELGWTPREALEAAHPWTSAEVQALTFAVQVALAEAWRARGVIPCAVLGHSVGEIAAAVTAGVLDRDEAARFACRRALAVSKLAGHGAMAMVAIPAAECRSRLEEADWNVDVAIHASPASTVVSGDRTDIERLTAAWAAEGIQVRAVDTDVAFHSAQVAAIADEVDAAAAQLNARPPSVALYSTTDANPRTTTIRDRKYWVRNISEPVLFSEAVTAALEDGYRAFLEVSTHPVVTYSIQEAALELGQEVLATGSLNRRARDREAMLQALGILHVNGVNVAWSPEGNDGELLDLPSVVWQHRPYWIFDQGTEGYRGGGHDPQTHSLLGAKFAVAGNPVRYVWQTELDLDSKPYPLSHELNGIEVTPAASLLNSFVRAVDVSLPLRFTDIALRTPLVVEPRRFVQVSREGNSLSLSSRVADNGLSEVGDEWLTHCTATLDANPPQQTVRVNVADLRQGLDEWPESEIHEMFLRMGVGGYAFPWTLEELRRSDTDQLAVLDLTDLGAATSWAHVIDAALTISAALVTPQNAEALWMSSHIADVVLCGTPASKIVVHSVHTPGLDHSVDAQVFTVAGDLIATVKALQFSPVDQSGLAAHPDELVYDIAWDDFPLAHGDSDRNNLTFILGGDSKAQELADQFAAIGGAVETAHVPTDEEFSLPPAVANARSIVLVPPSNLGQGDAARDAADGAWALIRSARALIRLQAEHEAVEGQRLWVLTDDARSATVSQGLAHASIWGAARIVAGEHPELWGAVVDLACMNEATIRTVATLTQTPGVEEDVLRVEADGTVLAQRLARVERPADKNALSCSASGTILITGGLGDLGLEAAQWLVSRGARRLLLCGRTPLPPRNAWDNMQDPEIAHKIRVVRRLENQGVSVRVLPLDVSDPAAVAEALSPGTIDMPPITGIVHAAGVVADDLVDNLGRDAIDAAFAAKASGAWTLHNLYPPGTVDFFIFFSSCGQLARLSGQAAYAASNSFLDGLARMRSAQGDPNAVSLAWTSWEGQGLSRNLSTTMLEANARGLGAISTQEALRAWAFADRFRSPNAAVLRVLPTQAGLGRLPAFRSLSSRVAAFEDASVAFSLDPTLAEGDSRQTVEQRVRREIAAELHAQSEKLDPRRPLVEMGVDSVMAVALRLRLTRTFGLDFSPTLLWAKPTIVELSEDIFSRLAHARTPEDTYAAPGGLVTAH